MPFMQWDESLSVNVAEIDAQHKQLIAMLNDLYTAMHTGKGREVASKTIQGLVDYAQDHFDTEEQYFEKYQYPKAASHEREHRLFCRKVQAFQQGFDAGKDMLNIEILRFLGEWITHHIKGIDQKYSAFLNSKGVK